MRRGTEEYLCVTCVKSTPQTEVKTWHQGEETPVPLLPHISFSDVHKPHSTISTHTAARGSGWVAPPCFPVPLTMEQHLPGKDFIDFGRVARIVALPCLCTHTITPPLAHHVASMPGGLLSWPQVLLRGLLQGRYSTPRAAPASAMGAISALQHGFTGSGHSLPTHNRDGAPPQCSLHGALHP